MNKAVEVLVMWKSLIYMAPLTVLFSINIYATELILSAPPRESKEAGEKLYTPLAEFLSRQLGQPVKYHHPDSWFTYQNKMRDDTYDIVFDGPHFASWRIAHLKHEVLVKLPGSLQFHLVARVDDETTKSAKELIGRYICGISPPNLSTLSVLTHYSNPVRQPIIKGINGGMGKVYKSLEAKKCSGAVLRTAFYQKKLSIDDRNKIKIILTSEPLPNQVITASKRISRANVEKLQLAFLHSKEGAGALDPILRRFAGKAKSFISAQNNEFDGNNQLLEGVIFGW
jgi:ABC-type phosphate/phosphonate transport system substrate-binding protein